MLKRVLKVLFVIVGSFVGAGFASGQEIYTFFYIYNYKGIIGIIISSLLIGTVIYKTIELCRIYGIDNYKEFLEIFIKNKQGIEIFNNIINIFILVTFFIMVAGFGAYFEQQLKIDNLIGSSIISVICLLVFINDISGLVKVNEYLVPILIICLVIVGTNVIDFKYVGDFFRSREEFKCGKWILDSVLYSGYNIILLIPVLISIKKFVKNKKENLIISILTVAGIIFLGIMVFCMLTQIDININNLEMPVVYIASKKSEIYEKLYGIVILSSILTTSVSLGTGLLKNICVKSKKQYLKISILICLTSIIVSNIGFANLINLLYPIFGYIGIMQIIKLIFLKITDI